MKTEVQNIIRGVWHILPAPEQAVLWCICEAYQDNKFITQGQIAEHQKFLGSHPVHESQIKSGDSTKRQVRQLVRNLRVDYKIPILSSNKGYKLPISRDELNEFVKDLERTAKAQARAWHETYISVRDHCELTSSFLNNLNTE